MNAKVPYPLWHTQTAPKQGILVVCGVRRARRVQRRAGGDGAVDAVVDGADGARRAHHCVEVAKGCGERAAEQHQLAPLVSPAAGEIRLCCRGPAVPIRKTKWKVRLNRSSMSYFTAECSRMPWPT